MHTLRLYSFALCSALNTRHANLRRGGSRKLPARKVTRGAVTPAAERSHATLAAADYCTISTRYA